MFLMKKKSVLSLGLASAAMTLSGCQNIQMAESPIPVTADFHPILVSTQPSSQSSTQVEGTEITLTQSTSSSSK